MYLDSLAAHLPHLYVKCAHARMGPLLDCAVATVMGSELGYTCSARKYAPHTLFPQQFTAVYSSLQ